MYQNLKLVRFLITQNISFSFIFLKMIYDPCKKDYGKNITLKLEKLTL